jgi:hypothetical protein
MSMKISYITWSHKPDDVERMSRSIRSLPTHDHEIIYIDNSVAPSMCQGYNLGTALASGDILVYLHSDVEIIDQRFVELVTKATEDPSTGFVGPIGALTVSPRYWCDQSYGNLRGWIVASGRENPSSDCILSFGAYDGVCRQMDGLLMATRKRFSFPSEILTNWHGVDLWMCAQAERDGFTNRIFSVGVRHQSWGETSSEKFIQAFDSFKSSFPELWSTKE